MAATYSDIFEAGVTAVGYRGIERLADMNDAADVIDEMQVIQFLARQDPAVVQSGRRSRRRLRTAACAEIRGLL